MNKLIDNLQNRLPSWKHQKAPLSIDKYSKFDAIIQIVSSADTDAPYFKLISSVIKRNNEKKLSLVTTPDGSRLVRLVFNKNISVFKQMEKIRKYLSRLGYSKSLAIDFRADSKFSGTVATSVFIFQSDMSVNNNNKCTILFSGINKKTIEESCYLAEANTVNRYLCKMPPNELTPPVFTKLVKEYSNKHQSLSIKIIDKKQLAKMGAGAFLAVTQSSRDEPYMVILKYRRGKDKKSPPLALIGKGVCYDTGGINLKPARSMRGMKEDMAGAAAVLSATLAAAKLNLDVNIDCYLPLVDNSISPDSYRPDDVITALNGKKIEIVHSDAEGRMILADTLTLATSGQNKPLAVITMATLTGAMDIAVGQRMSGYFSNHGKLRNLAQESAECTGERLCYFPLPSDYKSKLKSDVADIKQKAADGLAGHIMAALFLSEFVENKTPWVHMDMAATSCGNGLAAAPGPETGFGSLWLLAICNKIHLIE